MRDITPLVAPRSIAVIGASANPTKSGGVLFNNLVKGDFQGPLYPSSACARLHAHLDCFSPAPTRSAWSTPRSE